MHLNTSFVAPLGGLVLALGTGMPVRAQQPPVRIGGMSATLRATDIDAVALITGTPTRVVFELVPACVTPTPAVTRVEATRRASRPEALTAYGPTVADYVARLPAPARFGAFTGRVIAYDRAGTEVARSEADWVRPFTAQVSVTPSAPAVDVSALAAEAVLRIDVRGTDAIDAIAVQTSAFVSAELGYGSLPYEAAQEMQDHGPTWPSIQARLARTGATAFELRFSVPAGTPPRTLGVSRVYLRSRTCHSAELSVENAPEIRVTSASPRPAALDVRVERARQDLVVTFRYQGPIVGRARTRFGLPVPNVEARVRDAIRSVRARCEPAESPLADPPWGGESMTCRLRTATRGGHPLGPTARVQLVAGSHVLGEAPLASLARP